MPRIGRDIEQARGIQRNMYCGACGYNLRTRGVVGRCPECGGEYDSRPLGMRGILLPQDLGFPWGDYFRWVLSAGGGVLLIYYAVVDGASWAWWPAVPLLVFAVMYLFHAGRQTAKWYRYRALIRRIDSDEDD